MLFRTVQPGFGHPDPGPCLSRPIRRLHTERARCQGEMDCRHPPTKVDRVSNLVPHGNHLGCELTDSLGLAR